MAETTSPEHLYAIAPVPVVDEILLLRERVRARDEAIARLTGELAKYTGWEPTVREEYEHACQQASTITDLVRAFRSEHPEFVEGPDSPDAVSELVASIEKTLGVW